jgi:Ca2+/H+ antiporter
MGNNITTNYQEQAWTQDIQISHSINKMSTVSTIYFYIPAMMGRHLVFRNKRQHRGYSYKTKL